MSTLFEITDEARALLDMLEDLEAMEQDGSIDAEELEEQRQLVTDTLEGVKGELEIKAEAYVAVCNQLEAQASIFKAEVEKWQKKQRASENALKRLKQAIFDAMVELGLDDKKGLDTGKYKLKIVGNGGMQPIEVTEIIDDIPEEYIRIKKEADKKAIGEYLKNLPEDVEVPWAHLLPRGRHLSIK